MVDHKLGFQRQAKAKWSAGQGYRLRNCQQGVFGAASDAPPTTVHMWLYSRSLPHLSPTTSYLSVSPTMIYISRQVCFKGMLVAAYPMHIVYLSYHSTTNPNKTKQRCLLSDWQTCVRIRQQSCECTSGGRKRVPCAGCCRGSTSCMRWRRGL